MAVTFTSAQQATADAWKKANPDWTDEDVLAWGKRTGGAEWQTPATGGTPSSGATGSSSSGGSGETLPPSTLPPPTSGAAPSPSQAPTTPDPFTSMGGGVYVNGMWVPKDHPAAAGVAPPTAPGGNAVAMPGVTIPPPVTPAENPMSPGVGTNLNVPTPGWMNGNPAEVDPDGGSGAGDVVAGENPARTITINGQVYTIPGGVDIDSNQTTGDAPSADAADLNYSPEDPMMAVVREQLLAMMARANDPVSMDDPTIKAQADANYASEERARRALMEQTAARYGARGLGSSGAMDAAMRQGYEDVGQNVGEFNAGLISDEQAARRDDLKSALGMANELGMFKEQNKLQRDLAVLDTETKTNLANLDAELKNAGLSVQERLGIMDAELKKYGIDLQGDMGLLNMVLENEFNYAQLKMQGDIANLDATVKTNLANLDAQLRREGLSTQERLAALDAEVRKYGIDTQGNLGNLEVALRRELGIGQLNLGLLQTLLNNQQFNDQLGWDMGSWAAEQNSNIMDYLN